MTALQRLIERLPAYLLGTALTYGVLAQGGFYRHQYLPMIALVGIAALCCGVPAFTKGVRAHWAPVTAWTAAAIWIAVAATQTDSLRAASGPLTMVLGLAATYLAVRNRTNDTRRLLTQIVCWTGALVALSSFAGIALHHEPLAIPSQALWRGASTLTYANAAGAYILLSFVLFLDSHLRTPNRWAAIGVYITTLGLLTTLSRAAFLGVLVAIPFLIAAHGRRRTWRRTSVVAALAFVPFATLLPSLPEASSAHTLLALAGLAVGAGAAELTRRRIHRHLAIGCVAIAVLMTVTLGVHNRQAISDAAQNITTTRLNVKSTDRSDLFHVTWGQFVDAPVFGVGTGNIDFAYTNSAGVDVQAEYTHNEYLQLATESGLPAALLVIAGLGTMMVALWRNHASAALPVLGALLAFAVQSGLDFLWHLPVLALAYVIAIAAFHPPSQAPQEPLPQAR